MCENNGYGEFTPQANHQAIVDVADRAAGYGMPGVVVDGMDAIAVYEAAGEAVERARKGAGPTLLECKTYRFYDHVGIRGMGLDVSHRRRSAANGCSAIRSSCSKRAWPSKACCPHKKAAAVHAEVQQQVKDGIKFAEDSPFPDAASLLDDVYATGS